MLTTAPGPAMDPLLTMASGRMMAWLPRVHDVLERGMISPPLQTTSR